MEVTVKDRQTLADIAIQVLGSFEGIFNLAARNEISITAQLSDGDILQWDTEDIVNTTVKEKYNVLGLTPATDISTADYDELIAETDSPITIYGKYFTDYNEDENVYTALEALLHQAITGEELTVSQTTEISLTKIFDDPYDSTFA